ncbi:hypothetical protein [Bacillus cereus]|uniref:hypothetical protein n=1 Tax=Bacillus cereus TaxID=1396 RepID=UPI000BF43253|nr:hypothetical protein [Bacillus cereus]PEW02725.1 hypothetical protein CN440_29355 [Bacillus cereus]
MKVSNKSKVLLSRKLWERAQSKDDLKQSIARYIQTGYPGYWIEKVIKENESYIAICTRGL